MYAKRGVGPSCPWQKETAPYPEPVERHVYDQVYRLNTGISDRV